MVIPPSRPAPLRLRAARGLARGPLARSLRQHRRRRGRVTAARLGARNGSLSCPATPPAPQTAAVGAGARVAGEGGSDPGGPDTGGGSDANLLVALGVPCIDGLGPYGEYFHQVSEWCSLRSLVRRTAALAWFLAEAAAREYA